MRMVGCVVVLLALAMPGFSAFSTHNRRLSKNDQYVAQFGQPLEHRLRHGYSLNQHDPTVPRQLSGFHWENCNTSLPIVDVIDISFSPDTFHFPGDEKLSAQFNIKKPLTAPMQASLVLKKKELGLWIEVPCIEGVGSCTYDDLCAMLSKVGQACPKALLKIGIKCSCPIKQNKYSLQNADIPLPDMSVPSGDYKLKVTVTLGDDLVTCLAFTFSVS